MFFNNNLLLRNSFYLIKQNTILYVLEWVKKTQVKFLSKDLNLIDGLVEALSMLLHNLFLVNEKLLLMLLVGLPLPSSLQLGLLRQGL